MKKLLITSCLVMGSFVAHSSQPMTAQEHAKQVMLQLQEQNQQRGVAFVTVGDQVSCDFRLGTTRIQDAIDSGIGEIRIAESTYNENLIIDDISVTLKGGYEDCADAENDIRNTTIQEVSGAAVDTPTIQIQGSTQRNTVNIEQLSITGGDGNGFFAGGGISTLAADLALNITNSWISNNNGILGGGMAVISGDTDVSLVDTWIVSNVASASGGGIYCSGAEASVLIFDNGGSLISGVVNNNATDDGGGAKIELGCVLTSFSGSTIGGFDFRGFSGNTAGGNGGAIAVESGSALNLNGSLFCFFGCIGDNTQPLSVLFNNADGFGGGVYGSGDGTTINITNGLFRDNTASAGAGVTVEDQASLTIGSLYAFNDCWNPGECSLFENNETFPGGSPNRGGGLYATTGAVVEVSRTAFRGNRADFGTAFYGLGSDSDPAVTSIDMEGSLLAGNGDDGADGWSDIFVMRTNGADVKMDFNTVADNNVATSSLSVVTGGTLALFSSIIHEPGLDVFDGIDANFTGDCLIVNEDSSFTGLSETAVDDPEFVNRGTGDFHLNAAISPALDFCDTFFSTPDFNDSDDDVRGFDDPSATNNLGPYDVGYDETYDNDIIFEDNFDD